MPRQKRANSFSGCYHVMAQGNGGQIIYESDMDRYYFLKLLRKYKEDYEMKIYAYCLMGNHFHLLIKDEKNNLSQFMHDLLADYAGYFNRSSLRVGHLFRERFKSETIDSEEYLITAFSYILNNPVKAGLGPVLKCKWNSVHEYMNHAQVVDVSDILDIFNGLDSLLSYVDKSPSAEFAEPTVQRRTVTDEEALELIRTRLHVKNTFELNEYSQAKRDSALRQLKGEPMTVRQLERLTGISKSTILRAWKESGR